MKKTKIIRITTVPLSLEGLLKGQLKYMNQFYDVIGVSSPGKDLQYVSDREGVKTYEVKMTRQISPIRDLFALWKLFKLFRHEKPDIVHSHTPKAGTLGMIASYLAQVPIRIHTVAGLPLMESRGFKRLILNVVEKLTYACASKVYPNSSGLSKFIVDEKFCDKDKLKIIGKGSSNGIDTSHFSLSQINSSTIKSLKDKYSFNGHHIVFCFVGRLVGDKGINELISAFLKVYNNNNSCRLLLVGTFEKELDRLDPETEKMIDEHEAIIWVGFQEDVRPFLAMSDIFTFPSYREGFPNVVMQAGAMELPSIVTNINGCNEIIEDNVNGLIIPVKDVPALYNAMYDLMVDEIKRKILISNSRTKIVENYERQYIWNELHKEYSELLKN
ncbi:MAG: glycosyltransferase family 4 protein [Carboxylicivirga sp.]|jgi:glycosyltransferase involved in cell wall biosynthesis|nr:glycosyltransferase family 4 protein [Carboxylicivirga sp.]